MSTLMRPWLVRMSLVMNEPENISTKPQTVNSVPNAEAL